MTQHSSLTGARRTLLNSLGLPPDASDEELAARRTELRESLKTAPDARKGWISQQMARVDAVIALDAAGDVVGADDGAGWGDGPDESSRDEVPGAGEAPEPDDPVALDEIDEVAEARRAARRTTRKAAVIGADANGAPPGGKGPGRATSGAAGNAPAGSSRRRVDATGRVARIVIVAVVVAVVLTVYRLGTPSDSSGSDASASGMISETTATPALDEAQVAELEKRVQDDPQDTDAMGRLASLYASVGDYANASKWQARRVELMPDDVDAQLTLGVSCFNNGDLDCAKEHWDIVNDLDPDRAELHFDLGYYYLSVDPPDIEKVKQEWNKVLELDPDGQYAQTVKTHMSGLDETAAPSATSTP